MLFLVIALIFVQFSGFSCIYRDFPLCFYVLLSFSAIFGIYDISVIFFPRFIQVFFVCVVIFLRFIHVFRQIRKLIVYFPTSVWKYLAYVFIKQLLGFKFLN